MYEELETRGITADSATPDEYLVAIADILPRRSWSVRGLRQVVRRAERAEWVQDRGDGRIRLTAAGFREAARLAHEHRLLELYLITHADVAPSHVDRGADTIEHYLDPALIEQLEAKLLLPRPTQVVRSPHPLP
jgi:manganese/zinc/iron transport system permease protein